MDWKLRKFSELNVEEIYEILKVRNQVFIVEQNCPYEDCDEKDKNSYHMFLSDKGKVVAYIRIPEKGVSYDEVSIGRVLVNKDYRGNNFGREIMIKGIEFIEKDLKEKSIRISAQEYLREFYKSLGFKEVSEAYLEDNIPHIEMLYKSKSN